MTEIVFVLGFSALAVWRRWPLLWFLAGTVALIWGMYYIPEWRYGLPLVGLGLGMLYEGIMDFWRR